MQYSPISYPAQYFTPTFVFFHPNFVTPEERLPSSPGFEENINNDEIKATLGTNNEPPQTELNFDNVDYDFLYDPCTCCPASWANDENEEEVSSHFGFG
ncbi:hypothetical protein GPJ56_000375 [Histomonas meleagridis]|uniref:uncharacterized protein n=1 Tax=Histomonas meleagridis TaxID=135588 RepID=UPI00355AC7A7|nr:hypothetical protein GPJ56_000375 [Histomonas meleagridis]KAH0796585.1 hypothetical protein GO595_010478 [Histomonas meleagridis]KAH0796586.1 hypothetical protein GO595_010479 [Histomonas meleagridis]